MREETLIEFGRNRFGNGFSRRISWSAVLAGVVAALGTCMLLALLGMGLGASTVNPLEESNPLAGLGAGAAIWLAITGLLAFFAGGWVAGYASGWRATRTDALIHGFLTWAVASLLGFWVMTGAAGALVSGGASMIGKTISGGAQAAAQSPELSARLREELEKLGVTKEALEQQAKSPETQARAEQRAREAGQAVAKGVSTAALGGFGLLVLNLLASLFGALVALRRENVEVERERAA
jgi:hypothetical protein